MQQLVAQIPWGHNIRIISKSKNIEEAIFYLNETFENNWSRDILCLQIETDLFERKGKAITNFSKALPHPNSDLANQTLKDPYLFDFLTLKKDADERSIEEIELVTTRLYVMRVMMQNRKIMQVNKISHYA